MSGKVIKLLSETRIKPIDERKSGLVEVMDDDLEPGEVREHPRWFPMNAFSTLDLNGKHDFRQGSVIIRDCIVTGVQIDKTNARLADITGGPYGVVGDETIWLELLTGETLVLDLNAEFREWCPTTQITPCPKCSEHRDAPK